MLNSIRCFKILFTFSLICFKISNAILLNRSQLLSWYGPSFINETQLFLDHKQISLISTDTFVGLNELKYLALDFNQLTAIDPLAFSLLTSLERLSLSSNQLQHIDAVATFSNLVNLKILNLSWNQLTSIDRNSFVGLINLEKVYMGSNPISLIQPSFVLKLCSATGNPKCTVYL